MAVAVFALYLSTLAAQHTYDALMFVSAIHSNAFSPTVFRPHNLLYLPSVIALRHGLLAIGATGRIVDPFVVGQLVAAFWGAVAAGLFWLLVSRILPGAKATLMALLFATTNAQWSMSTEVEVYTTSLVCVMAVYLVLARRRPRFSAAGIAWGLAVLGHITNVLLAVPLAILCVRYGNNRAARMRSCVRLLLPTVVIGAGTYAVVGFLVIGTPTIGKWIRWIGNSALVEPGYGVASSKQILLAVQGASEGLVAGHCWNGLLPVACLIVLSLLLIRKAGAGTRIMASFLVSHFLTYAVFFTWWEPLNIEFWVVPLLPACLLIALGWRSARRPWTRRTFGLLAVLALVTQWHYNFGCAKRRMDPAGDYWLSKTRQIAEVARTNDLVLTFSEPIWYAMGAVTGVRNVTSVLALEQQYGHEEACRKLQKRAAIVRQQGGRIYATGEALDPNPADFWRLKPLTLDVYRQDLDRALGTTFSLSIKNGLLYY